MEKEVLALAEKELKEQIRRGKPKDVKKLHEILTKMETKESADQKVLELLGSCYELMPNGRYRLNAKDYGRKIEEALKKAKTARAEAPKPAPQPKKKDPIMDYMMNDKLFMDMGGDNTPVGQFYEAVMKAAEAGDEERAAELYEENKELLFEELQKAYDRGETVLDDATNGGDVFFSNLVMDLEMALPPEEKLEFLERFFAMPMDAGANHGALRKDQVTALLDLGREEEALALADAARKELPGSPGIDHAIMFAQDMAGHKDKAAASALDILNGDFRWNIYNRYVLEQAADILKENGMTAQAEEAFRKLRSIS
ncbi:MAG: hypothetical protein IKD69_01415 [Solobacterium sp.]|nr:hypothetical protein [Solobacterium sp.]